MGARAGLVGEKSVGPAWIRTPDCPTRNPVNIPTELPRPSLSLSVSPSPLLFLLFLLLYMFLEVK